MESYRVEGKVRQKIVRHIGIAASKVEEEKLIELAELVKAQIEQEHEPCMFSPEVMAEEALRTRRRKEEAKESQSKPIKLEEYREEARYIVGIHEVYGSVYERAFFHKMVPNPARQKAASRELYHVVMARIANPDSKKGS